MPDIREELAAIKSAVYGEQVRTSIHDAIRDINEVVENWESGLLDTTLTSETLPAQSKAVGDVVNSLRMFAHSFIENNRVDHTTFTLGKYMNISGTIGNADGYAISDYIQVPPSTTLALYHGANTTIHGYKSDKSIGTLSTNYGGEGLSTPTTGSEDAYVRFSCKVEDIDSAYLCLASQYKSPQYLSRNMLKDNDIFAITGRLADRSVVSDVNTLGTSIYVLGFARLSEDIPDHLPWSKYLAEGTAILVTIGMANRTGTVQFLFSSNGDYYRQYSAGWENWQSNNFRVWVYPKGSTSQYLTNLTEAIDFARVFTNSVVKVYGGNAVYNIKDEFKELYGNDFFSTADFTIQKNKGIMLSNGITIEADNDATIVFDGTGLNSSVQDAFSIFNFLRYECKRGFTLKNVHAIATNCRYVVHDDPSGDTEPYHNIYKGCIFEKIATEFDNRTCIGAGLGGSGRIEITDCIFKCNGGNDGTGVSVHNNETLIKQFGNVIIKDNYFLNGTIYIRSVKTPPKKTPAIITNNNVSDDIWIASYPISAGYDGFDVYQWNNIKRS